MLNLLIQSCFFNFSVFIQEKFCHEIAGALDDENIAERIRPELDKIEVQLQALEKEESELRKVSWMTIYMCDS